MLSKLTSGFLADWKKLSLQVALLRTARASRILGVGVGAWRRRLFANPAFQRHVAMVAKDDVVFFLSHRHYLAKGLTPAQRTACALRHYEHEVAGFDPGYFDSVYRGHGLVLWRAPTDDGVFDVRLVPGNDVLYEGGASVVAHFNGVRIAVVSFSWVPTDIFLPGSKVAGDAVMFITRKQLTADHSYQKAFNKAFDRITAAHLCIGALTGIAMAQGQRHVLGTAAAVQPSYSPELEKHFLSAYDEFWTSLLGRQVSPYGFLVDLPMALTPLDQLDAKARKRAVARRRHIDAVRDSAHDTIRAHLLNPPLSVPFEREPDAVAAEPAGMRLRRDVQRSVPTSMPVTTFGGAG